MSKSSNSVVWENISTGKRDKEWEEINDGEQIVQITRIILQSQFRLPIYVPSNCSPDTCKWYNY